MQLLSRVRLQRSLGFPSFLKFFWGIEILVERRSIGDRCSKYNEIDGHFHFDDRKFFKMLVKGFDEVRQQFRYDIGKILRFLPLDMHVPLN